MAASVRVSGLRLGTSLTLTGTGLFVGSGSALANGGPASLVIAYGLIGIMLYCTVHALGELAVAFPIAGAFSVYNSRFVDPAWGFAMLVNQHHFQDDY